MIIVLLLNWCGRNAIKHSKFNAIVKMYFKSVCLVTSKHVPQGKHIIVLVSNNLNSCNEWE